MSLSFQQKGRLTVVMVAFAGVCSAGQSVSATAIYGVQAETNTVQLPTVQGSEPVATSVESASPGTAFATASANAGSTRIGVTALAATANIAPDGLTSPNTSVAASATAGMGFTDFVVDGSGAWIAGTLNLTLESSPPDYSNVPSSVQVSSVTSSAGFAGGGVEIGAGGSFSPDTGTAGTATGWAALYINGSVAGTSFSMSHFACLQWVGPPIAGLDCSQGQYSPYQAGGPYQQIQVTTQLVLDEATGVIHVPVTIPVNTPFAVSLNLEAQASADSYLATPYGSGDVWSLGGAFFGHTLTFAPDGVFTLPDGYTVNSVDAGIVDNQLAGSAVPVPEPGSLTLLVSGFVVAVRRHRRKA
jgi:hypothetical protein